MASSTLAETTGDTDPSTTTGSESTGAGPEASTGTTGTGTTVGIEDIAPWHGMWYALDPLTTVNEPKWWGSGGDSLGYTLFELRVDGATIYEQSCLFGGSQYEYLLVEEDGAILLSPVDGEHKFLPYGNEAIERLYLDPGADCNVLVIREIRVNGEEGELFSWAGGFKRGELCLECAPTQGTQGVVSDCGTPVPWQCPG